MVKKLFLLVLPFFSMCMAFSQEVSSCPRIEFETKEHEFGEIRRFSPAMCEFVFRNTGDEVLRISSVRTSNVSAVAELSSETINPGERGKITVRYCTGIIGKFARTITVSSNATNKRVILKINGFIQNTFQRQKKNGKWGVVKDGTKTIIPFEYDTIWQIDKDGYAVASKNGKIGIIDTANRIIIPFLYTEVNTYGSFPAISYFDSEGFAQLKKQGKWGIVNKRNQAIIPFIYDDIFCAGDNISALFFNKRAFSADNGHSYTKKDGKWVVINKSNQIVKSFD